MSALQDIQRERARMQPFGWLFPSSNQADAARIFYMSSKTVMLPEFFR